jgi:5'-3' exonuclease
MGIPSYFNFILKNHRRMLIENKHIICDNLFIDANSLIYDCIHELSEVGSNEQVYEMVYKKIIGLVHTNKPTHKTYVCFDGVPPLPKMVQQRQRRFKSALTKQILNASNKTWDTNQITPGTSFMKGLDGYLYTQFNKDKKIVFSGSDEKNEGEHKICDLIRSHGHLYENKNIVIYGLDADLIMLGLLLHSEGFHIYLYKETKHFEYISQIDGNKKYYFDLNVLATEIDILLDNNNMKQSVCDYIFMCFLCGNDFMPHVPAIHIRNEGIVRLIENYKLINMTLINTKDNTIEWGAFHKFIHSIQLQETNFIEQNIRWKMKAKSRVRTFNEEDRLNFLPCLDTKKERYLLENLDEYNSYILHDTNVNEICLAYLKMLEWTWYYYNGVKKNNDLCYDYAYGPRFCDLVNYIPLFNSHTFLTDNPSEDIYVYTLLYFVLPSINHQDIIPKEIYDCTTTCLYKHMPELKLMNFEFDYFLCKYFWESHLCMGSFDIKKLNRIVKHLNNIPV